ncbi:polysaccharide biosynthesis protein, partial [Paenibacillus sepulcri]|nr:polysaccharide biosynthesis protein [Paenibacillus sepulcri]
HLGWNDGSLAAGATAGSAFGNAAGLMVMAGYWLRDRAINRPEAAITSPVSGGMAPSGQALKPPNSGVIMPLMRRLAGLAVPVTLGALAVPALSVVDAFTVPRLLGAAGADPAAAMAQFGLYSRGQPLVQLVVMVAGAMG